MEIKSRGSPSGLCKYICELTQLLGGLLGTGEGEADKGGGGEWVKKRKKGEGNRRGGSGTVNKTWRTLSSLNINPSKSKSAAVPLLLLPLVPLRHPARPGAQQLAAFCAALVPHYLFFYLLFVALFTAFQDLIYD